MKGGTLRLTILSDNKPCGRKLIAKHSLSILVEKGAELYLFGMGADPAVLEHNVKELGVSLDIVDCAVVSHEHVAHYGGYRYLSAEAPFTSVFIPYGTMESLGRHLSRNGLRPVEISTWTRINEGVYVSRSFYGPPYEHFMVLERGDELVVLSGCMHPGVGALQAISDFFKKRVYCVVGGFHLSNAPNPVVKLYVKQLLDTVKPRLIIPLHCSGDRFSKELRESGLVEVVELATGDEFGL